MWSLETDQAYSPSDLRGRFNFGVGESICMVAELPLAVEASAELRLRERLELGDAAGEVGGLWAGGYSLSKFSRSCVTVGDG